MEGVAEGKERLMDAEDVTSASGRIAVDARPVRASPSVAAVAPEKHSPIPHAHSPSRGAERERL